MLQEDRPHFDVQVARRDGALLVRLEGDFDMAAAARAADALHRALAEAEVPVVVDLSALEFMDSTGFHCLIEAQRAADRRGARLVVLNGSGPAHRVLALTQADAVLEIVDDLGRLDHGGIREAPGG